MQFSVFVCLADISAARWHVSG